MNERLRAYIDKLFKDATETPKTVELKEEMLQNLTDKYNDLISEGKTEDAAYNIAVASIGDVSELIRSTKAPSPLNDKVLNRRAILETLAIVLYILCAVPVIVLQNELGVVLLFVMIATATGILIFNGVTKTRYEQVDGTMAEEFKAWKAENGKRREVENAITSTVWLVAVCVYFALSFFTGAWHITWLVFLIATAVCQVIRGVYMVKASEEK